MLCGIPRADCLSEHTVEVVLELAHLCYSGRSQMPMQLSYHNRNTAGKWKDFDGPPPNALALSCAAPIERESGRAETTSQKSPDLVDAKRRQLQRLVGPPAAVIRAPTACATHICTGPHGTTSQSLEPHAAHTITRSTTSAALSHSLHTIRLSITGRPHNKHWYHCSTTGRPHNERSNHTSTTSSCTTKTGTTSIQLCVEHTAEKSLPTTVPRWPNYK
jgi:hypothetical protein